MNKRPEPSERVAMWFYFQDHGPPRCCHTCGFYSQRGHCSLHGARPPDDYASSEDACPDWRDEIPF